MECEERREWEGSLQSVLKADQGLRSRKHLGNGKLVRELEERGWVGRKQNREVSSDQIADQSWMLKDQRAVCQAHENESKNKGEGWNREKIGGGSVGKKLMQL